MIEIDYETVVLCSEGAGLYIVISLLLSRKVSASSSLSSGFDQVRSIQYAELAELFAQGLQALG